MLHLRKGWATWYIEEKVLIPISNHILNLSGLWKLANVFDMFCNPNLIVLPFQLSTFGNLTWVWVSTSHWTGLVDWPKILFSQHYIFWKVVVYLLNSVTCHKPD